MNKTKVKERLLIQLNELLDPRNNPDRKSNKGSLLYELFIWQEIKRHAEDKLKRAWETAQAKKDGIVPDDDELRKLPTKEERIVVESDHFSCLVKLAEPRNNFDKDTFLDEVARRFKLRRDKLEDIAEGTVKKSAPALTKRIVEV